MANNENEEKGIKNREITEEIETSYLDYAMSVIVSRALPDVRDGLKPVHRRILFAMNEMGLKSSAKFRKSATVVGEVLGKYHPHGDVAVYDTLVRMAQDFNLRYPLIAGQGNFGSIDGDAAAAMRYTECKMKKISTEILKDIKKGTVDFMANYDGTKKEPKVLPSLVPNLLINGTLGIAVGMATNIPPHNLAEVIEAEIYLVDHPKAEAEDLMQYIAGPDFPTGGKIYNEKEILNAYATGRGKIVMRAESKIEEGKRGAYRIVVTEIPYQINKSALLQKIAELVKNKKIKGISDLRDESDREGIRIVIELKKDAYPKKILNQLYKYTTLQDAFHVNMVALKDGINPRLLTLPSILSCHIAHRREIIIRRTKFELKRARERRHILAGLKIALAHIDAVIKLIKKSKDRQVAKIGLRKKFKLSEVQAEAILDMRLSQLAALERQEIENEYKEVGRLIKEFERILKSERKVKSIIKKELREIKEKYGDKRRTKVYKKAAEELGAEELVPNEPVIIVLTEDNYIKRLPVNTYKSQARGGKGVIGMTTKEEDRVEHLLVTYTHNNILFFTNLGRVFENKVYDIPEATRQAKGQAIVNILQIAPKEKVTALISLEEEVKARYLIMVTRKGMIKKTKTSEYKNIRKSGLIAVGLKENDELVAVRATSGKDEIILSTAAGQSIRFKESDIRAMGRSAAGVKGIKLSENDFLIGMGVISRERKKMTEKTTAADITGVRGIEAEDAEALINEVSEEREVAAKVSDDFLVVMENGYGKKTTLTNYKIQKRGGRGIKTAKVTTKTGKIVKSRIISKNARGDLVLISDKGQTIRIPVSSVSRLGRATQGVRLMRLNKNDKVASVIYLAPETASQSGEQKKVASEAKKQRQKKSSVRKRSSFSKRRKTGSNKKRASRRRKKTR